MAISQGKLALYTAAAGIDPASSIPISLDFGTDNEELLANKQYLGWPARRIRGSEYVALVDEFVTAVRSVMPRALIQWEDFRKDNALAILDRYSDVVPSFNDDIQGTGAVVVAGLNSALKIKGERLSQQRIVIFGAGAAGLGVTRQIKAQLVDEGLKGEDQTAVIAELDRSGLLVEDGKRMDEYKRALAWPAERARSLGLLEPSARSLANVVRQFRPTVLIGVSGVAGAFDEPVVREMAKHVERPVIFPSSNPSTSSEAEPAQLYAWTSCRCLVATGSPFRDVVCGGRIFRVGQGNNVFVFPGLGLAAIAANASKVTHGMTKVASEALAAQVTDEERSSGLLFPSVSRLRAVSYEIAVAVVRQAVYERVANVELNDIERLVREARWSHAYRDYVAAR
jgi:malate dehydrogenase (oxaloacetate-decarboxylating)